MNARDRKIMNVGGAAMAARIFGVAAGAALLAGCVGEPIASTRVNPSSPIAAEVAKTSSADRDYPSFNEIPPKPTDVRPPRIYGERAKALEAARDEMDVATAPSTWTLGQTGAFEARARTDAGPAYAAPAGADTEAFANTIRRRATPPPPTKR